MERLNTLIKVLQVVRNIKITRTTLDGIAVVKITIGGVVDPASIKRTYDDIDKIFKSNPDTYKVKEERDAEGKFKSFTVTT